MFENLNKIFANFKIKTKTIRLKINKNKNKCLVNYLTKYYTNSNYQ